MNLTQYLIINNNKLHLDPNETIEKVYDSYLTIHDEELFLCRTNQMPLKWVAIDKITQKQYDKLKKRNKVGSCNTDKESAYSCCIKCKTRGIVLSTANCGIIYSYREIFRSEGLRQVGNFYLDTIDSFKSIFFKYNLFNNAADCFIDSKDSKILGLR